MRRAAALAAVLLAGCGGADEDELVVSAASSLRTALTACTSDGEEPRIRLQFAGSDELATQIRKGIEPDVYVAANTELPEQLAREGLLEQPVVFATNELVVAVPEDSSVDSLDDLGAEGTRIVIGSESVPVGLYTRALLDRLDDGTAQAIQANVRSEEPDVKGIVGKLTQGAGDAGFVYATDVRTVRGLRAVRLGDGLRPRIAYAAGVLRGTDLRDDAVGFVDGLRDGPCAEALREGGFGRP